jgi:molybdopterin synthase catalytic subunit
MKVCVQADDFDVSTEIIDISGNPRIGAVASFVGIVRDVPLTLEHYPGMTEKKLAEIEAKANARWPLQASLIVHRYGRMLPGEPIVLVATASAHRAAALEACAFLIDWLKTQAPFWKLEETAEASRWVDARRADDAAAARWQD